MQLKQLLRKLLNEIRNFLYFKIRYRGVKYGKNIYVQWSVKIWSPPMEIELGNNVGIGNYSVLNCDIKIGNNVLIGPACGLVGADAHTYSIVGKTMWDNPRGDSRKIVIEDDVWIGYGSIILSGVIIGRGAIVGAGSVVVKPIEPYSIVAGVPARLIKMRFTQEEIIQHELKLMQDKL